MTSPASSKAVGRLTILPHGQGSIVNTKINAGIEKHQYLSDDDYALQCRMMDEGDYEMALRHNALALPALPLTKELILNKPPREAKGRAGMARTGRAKVKASAAVMERYIGRDDLAFLTVTVPEEAYVIAEAKGISLNELWPDIIHNFNMSLRREMTLNDVTPTWVYVTEVQSRRWANTGRVGLHAHYLIRGKKRGAKTWALSHKDYKRLWMRAIESVIGESLTGAFIVDVQRVKKSAVAYLGKYMSKGGDVVQEINEQGMSDELPAHWWGSTRGLKERVKRDTFQDQGEVADWFWEMCWNPDEVHFKWCFPVLVDMDGTGERLVGFAFELTPEFYEDVYQNLMFRDPP